MVDVDQAIEEAGDEQAVMQDYIMGLAPTGMVGGRQFNPNSSSSRIGGGAAGRFFGSLMAQACGMAR